MPYKIVALTDSLRFPIQAEYINISHYSPFSHINEVSPQYRFDPFQLPFILVNDKPTPVHPDTFTDLGLKRETIVHSVLAYPTSSFRTVYEPESHLCYKLPLLRKITRGLRDLPNKELERSARGQQIMSQLYFPGFKFLPETQYFAPDPHFNFIVRQMPNERIFPWFYVIASQDFAYDFELHCAEQIIKSWMYFASKGICLEYHTQNILFDITGNLYYRDLSDLRVPADDLLKPSYVDSVNGFSEVLSTVFDRAVCNQNLDHLFRYSLKLGAPEKNTLKKLILNEIKKYSLPFPNNYSMDFSMTKAVRVPEKTPLTEWRTIE